MTNGALDENENRDTAPLPAAEQASEARPTYTETEPEFAGHHPWRPSPNGLIMIAVASAVALSMVSFGAGWSAHGMARRIFAPGGFAAQEFRAPGAEMRFRGGPEEWGFDGRGPAGCPGVNDVGPQWREDGVRNWQ